MADPIVLERQKDIALAEAIQVAERLLGDEAQRERLTSAQIDVVGRSMPEYRLTMLVAELTGVVADQQGKIAELEKASTAQERRIKKLSASLSEEATAKK